MFTPGMKAYQDVKRVLVKLQGDPTNREQRVALRRRLQEITMKLTSFELRHMSDAPPIRSRCCGG